MTYAELKAVADRADAEGRDEKAWVFTFVSDGPHGLPIRPELLSETADGERVYAMTVKQLRKVLRLAEQQGYDRP